MQKTITLNGLGLKMSVCSEFVEHIWKPGSCKNCFHPRSDHQKPQAPADGKAGDVAVHNLSGIRIKSENTQHDDDVVIAALYSKPTIAVKPTMITSDAAEVWTEMNSTETLTQVSWKLSSSSNSVLKSGDISKVIFENFNKPFGHNFNSGENTAKCILNGPQSPDNVGINAVNNLTYVSHFGGQADKATFIKEKLPLAYEDSNSVNSSGSRPNTDRASPHGTLVSRDNTGYPCSPKSESESSKNLHFSKIKVSVHSESDTLSDALSYISVKDIPVASPTNVGSHTSEFHSSKEYRPNLTKHSQQLTHTKSLLQCQAEGNQSEPIYAESTKRKGVSGRVITRTEGHTEKNIVRQENNAVEETLQLVNSDRMYQESMTQVSAKITVMAAHTEEDNRTIYLSSPDSAVGVQWTCTSPSSSIESATLSPTFLWGEGSQGKLDIKSEVNKTYKTHVSSKIQGNSSLVATPKITKTSECTTKIISSPTRTAGILPSVSHKKESLDAHDRCLPPGDRRRFYQAMRSKQNRIDEEEEEEMSNSQHSRATVVGNGPLVKSSTVVFTHEERTRAKEKESRKGISKSSSCPVELSKVDNDTEEGIQPPPPPPKKQLRSPLNPNKNSSELENFNLGSVESLEESFKATNVSNSNVNINVSFSTGSMDSLDSRTCSEGGQSLEAIHSPTLSSVGEKKHFGQVDPGEEAQSGSLKPPPLPVKKSINRACSAPDNSAWGRSFPGRNGVGQNIPRLNPSHSEGNMCGDETPLAGCPLSPADKHIMFSSSESLEKCCKGSSHRNEVRNRNQIRVNQTLSTSQLSVSSHTSSGSSLQLHHLLSNIDSKEGMYAKLSGLYAQSTRRLMNKCEDYFMRDQRKELRFNENNWSLFKLTSNKPCCNAGDAIYYCATCAKDPLNNYAVKMCRTEDTKTSYCSLSLPVHFNIQQDCGHFVATVPSSMLHPSETSKSCPTDESAQTVSSSEQECVVVITREVPYRTTADFVRGSVSTHKSQPEVYERHVCLLLLQLCNGLEHLKEHGIIHRDLCLENLLLVHCQSSPDKIKDRKYVPRLIVSNFSKAKQRPGSDDFKPKRDKTRLAPEIMAASQYKKFDEFQTGILIYELLHLSNPFEDSTSLQEQEYSQKDLPSLPNLSVYSRGLQHLSHLLLEADPIKRIRISEAKRILQCLLWGPRKDLTDQPFSHEEALHCALQNWIDMKRSLLMMKFAEKALETEQNISLEDWLCCQYLASADPCYLYKTLKLIKLI
ncbi:inactive tyrosine-protein kinase PRAG1 [Spea bombifrons]|uniref:inactive tyrosine-protein kinase PRAG1 n=1 Tax=Spea bombifrons TaxID=233779 RepID=UPI00234A1BA6|nr:inactive tyrosine-protein kinase PRAG1 [Spea bombifrons]